MGGGVVEREVSGSTEMLNLDPAPVLGMTVRAGSWKGHTVVLSVGMLTQRG